MAVFFVTFYFFTEKLSILKINEIKIKKIHKNHYILKKSSILNIRKNKGEKFNV